MTRRNAPTRASPSVVQAKYARKFAYSGEPPTSSSTHAGTVSLAGPKRCSSNKVCIVGRLEVDLAGAQAIGARLGDKAGSGIDGA